MRREERKKKDLAHQIVRFCTQIVFFIMAPGVFSGAFNAVKNAFTQIGVGAPIEVTSFAMLFIMVCAFTIVFGRFFCGYACAFGTLGDVLYMLPEPLRAYRAKKGKKRLRFPLPLVRVLSFAKYIVLFAICFACFVGVWGAYSGYSPWVVFANMLSGTFEGLNPVALALLCAIAVGMMVRERFFCQFLCPLGAVFSFLPVMPFSQYTRVRAHCARSCSKCRRTCPVDIAPDADVIEQGECISCGRCADACPMANVNMVAIEKSFAKAERKKKQGDKPRAVLKTKDKWHLLRGSGIGYTLLKAALLLVLCWWAGALRYVPSCAEVLGLLGLPL